MSRAIMMERRREYNSDPRMWREDQQLHAKAAGCELIDHLRLNHRHVTCPIYRTHVYHRRDREREGGEEERRRGGVGIGIVTDISTS